jgi:hypothetical protein
MEQRGHIPFRIGVVSLAPTGVIDGPLEVNHDERGILGQRTGQPAGHALILERFSHAPLLHHDRHPTLRYC